MGFRITRWLVLGLMAAVGFAQSVLTNETVMKMVRAGLSDDVVLTTIRNSAGRYDTSPDGLIALKTSGASDAVISAVMAKAKASAAAPSAAPVPAGAITEVPAEAAAVTTTVNEIGVYYRKGEGWAEIPPEVVNFKTGGALKTIGTVGIVKGDVNGHINGDHSRTGLKTPVSLLVYAPEGVAITEYQLLRLRDTKEGREFRTMTGGVLHVSGGATRDMVPFESRKTAPRTWEIVLPGSLGMGEFGLLPPSGADSSANSGRIGKIYSFRIVE